jgi:hypothetical protein
MKIRVCAALCWIGSLMAVDRICAEERVIIGRVENVVMQDVGMKVKARIDTGAGVSSIRAKVVKIDRRADGERITFALSDDQGRIQNVERKIVEWAEIKSMATKTSIRRPVVILDICLGGKRLEGRFNLADRSGFLYPVLVGRNILKTGDFLIDPKQKFTAHPGCARD